jgi:outer membrane lipoprotein-sorting protein
MKLLRTLPTSRLLILVAAFVALAAAGAAIALGAGGAGPAPPAKPLDQAIHDALSAPALQGVTARISFTNNLFPSGALAGNAGSALMSGASGRLWATDDGRGRLELQSDAGDVQIVWNQTAVTVYDASSNTVYRATLPARKDTGTGAQDTGSPPTLAQIDSFLSKLGAHVAVSGANPTNVGDQPAYSVSGSPQEKGGLVGSLELAWDAARGVPLRIGVYAKGASAPVLELTARHVSYGPVAASDVDISPPGGAKVVDLGKTAHGSGIGSGQAPRAVGLPAVQAAAGFPVSAPDTLAGLARTDVRLVGSADSPSVVVVYGDGLGSIGVLQRKADAAASGSGNPLSGLPTVSLNGVTAHELTTQLGTALEWRTGGVAYLLAGSVPQASAEAAARGL